MEEFNNYMKEKQLINKRFSSKKITKLMGELNYEKSKIQGNWYYNFIKKFTAK